MNPSKFFKKREATQASAAGVIAMKHVLEYSLHFKILRTDSLQILIIIFVLIIEMKKTHWLPFDLLISSVCTCISFIGKWETMYSSYPNFTTLQSNLVNVFHYFYKTSYLLDKKKHTCIRQG